MDSLIVVKTVHIITAFDCSETAAKRNYEALIFQYETSIINSIEVRCIMKFPTRSRQIKISLLHSTTNNNINLSYL